MLEIRSSTLLGAGGNLAILRDAPPLGADGYLLVLEVLIWPNKSLPTSANIR